MANPLERLGISGGQVDRAGGVLRAWYATGLLVGPEEQDASRVLNAYRSEFQMPLRLVVMGLRSAVRTADVDPRGSVAERLKRQPRVIEKLIRFPNMRLTQMQDIAGCRAILPDLATVDRVRRLVERQKSTVVRADDYNAAPRPSGYRAVHLIVEREGASVEMQLRTPHQQRWAELVEDLDKRYRFRLKDDEGPTELLEYLRVYALALAQLDQTGSVEEMIWPRLAVATDAARRVLAHGDRL